MTAEQRPTALITGALGGIGTSLVQNFAAAGYRVIAADRRPDEDVYATYVHFDIARFARSEEFRRETIAQLRELIGPIGLKVLVNNAAVQRLNRTDEITTEEMHETFDTNVLGPFFLIQGLLPDLERANGSVVNVASVHAMVTKPGFVAYASSKTALVGLTRALAVDLGPRCRVNCVLPAATDTPMLRAGFEGNPAALAALAAMHPIGRISTPTDVSRVVLYLASADAGAITGAALTIDGGIGGRLHDPA